MTALGFVETATMEGQGAIIHTAAASNLGQMLLGICQEDDIPLVNIVRRAEHVDLLSGQSAEYVVYSSDEDFTTQLHDAIDTTGAYFGFDPIGGGRLVDSCFKAMEQIAVKKMSEYSRYGSDQLKKMYTYGRLDLGPTILTPTYGFGWTLSGWLLTPFLQQAGMETVLRMRQRVLEGLTIATRLLLHLFGGLGKITSMVSAGANNSPLTNSDSSIAMEHVASKILQ